MNFLVSKMSLSSMSPTSKLDKINIKKIPDTIGEIDALLKKDPNHPGLLAAKMSASNKRSPHTATLILFGITGAGKSSTVNRLFNTKDLATIGHGASETKTINEFEIELEIEEKGISNACLRIVDTPGFSDTSGAELDAQLLASLHKYFSEKKNPVTCILVIGKFDDNRYDGKNSQFVKMLKAVESLRSENTSASNANVVFIMTHYMKAKKNDRNDPTESIGKFTGVIRRYTSFANPTILLAENEPEDEDLKLENGYYKFPNGDYFPRNIFTGIQYIIYPQDPIGEVIIRSIYKEIKKYKVKKNEEINFVKESDPNVMVYQNHLNQINKPVAKNEINDLLSNEWVKMTQNFDNGFLFMVQKTFERLNISTKADLPSTPGEIQKLVKELPRNEHLLPLLQFSCGIQIPKLEINPQTGYSFNIMEDDLISLSIFKENPKYIPSPTGLCIPSHLIFRDHLEWFDCCDFLQTKEEYVKKRMQDLGISSSFTYEKFSFDGSFKSHSGYNVTSETNITKFSAAREIRLFTLSLKENLPLSHEFKESISDLPPFKANDEDAVQKYKLFFARYGTHVISECYGGGLFEISAQNSQASDSWKKENIKHMQAGLSFGLLKFFDFHSNAPTGPNESFEKVKKDCSISINFRGGNCINHQINPNLGTSPISELQNWITSLNEKPMMLNRKMKLTPISHFAKIVNSTIEKDIENASEKIIKAKMEYQKPQPPPPRENEPPPNSTGYEFLRTVCYILALPGIAVVSAASTAKDWLFR